MQLLQSWNRLSCGTQGSSFLATLGYLMKSLLDNCSGGSRASIPMAPAHSFQRLCLWLCCALPLRCKITLHDAPERRAAVLDLVGHTGLTQTMMKALLT